jgi:tRNA(Ile)-lysidine synthetase-like protein
MQNKAVSENTSTNQTDKPFKKSTWVNLNHRFSQQLRHLNVLDKKIIIAVSGGVDSVVLVDLFFKAIARTQRQNLVVAYVHHGGDIEYRNQAQSFCKELAKSYNLQFYALGPSEQSLIAENQLRIFRYQELLKLKERLKFDFVSTAHHQDDLLETRLIQLIRGSGLKGLRSLKPINDWKLRPALEFSKKSLLSYAKKCELKWMQDPSNQQNHFLRNWIRNFWLPQLQMVRPGSTESLARSLELICQSSEQDFSQISPMTVQNYWLLSDSQQKTVLGQMIFNAGYKNFSLGQVKEIQKRLDNPKKLHNFVLGPMIWSINAGLILVQIDPKHRT